MARERIFHGLHPWQQYPGLRHHLYLQPPQKNCHLLIHCHGPQIIGQVLSLVRQIKPPEIRRLRQRDRVCCYSPRSRRLQVYILPRIHLQLLHLDHLLDYAKRVRAGQILQPVLARNLRSIDPKVYQRWPILLYEIPTHRRPFLGISLPASFGPSFLHPST